MNKPLTHLPILLKEVTEFLSEEEAKVHMDCTLGLGGHMEYLLLHNQHITTAIGIDLDLSHLEYAKKRLQHSLGNRFSVCHFEHGGFDHIAEFAQRHGVLGKVDSILFDLGICSAHVDLPERGFSFMKDGPMDMRFDTSKRQTAADIVNTYSEQDLSHLFFTLGEEKRSRAVARAIVNQRKQRPFTRTSELAALCEEVITSPGKHHPATKVFQALRLEVNEEMPRLRTALQDAIKILQPGGRLAVLTYHSLEDRITKHTLRQESTDCICTNKKLPCTCAHEAILRLPNRKPILPSVEEINANPRARSAKLRLAIKT